VELSETEIANVMAHCKIKNARDFKLNSNFNNAFITIVTLGSYSINISISGGHL
jgi:hypothetical protein